MATKRALQPVNPERGKPARAYHLPAGEYWVRSIVNPALGFRLVIGDGPHGIGVQIDTHVGTPELTIASPDVRHLELCQYADTSQAQAFKRWYLHEETAADLEILGPSYVRKAADHAV